jgi:hypothetical protein
VAAKGHEVEDRIAWRRQLPIEHGETRPIDQEIAAVKIVMGEAVPPKGQGALGVRKRQPGRRDRCALLRCPL